MYPACDGWTDQYTGTPWSKVPAVSRASSGKLITSPALGSKEGAMIVTLVTAASNSLRTVNRTASKALTSGLRARTQVSYSPEFIDPSRESSKVRRRSSPGLRVGTSTGSSDNRDPGTIDPPRSRISPGMSSTGPIDCPPVLRIPTWPARSSPSSRTGCENSRCAGSSGSETPQEETKIPNVAVARTLGWTRIINPGLLFDETMITL